MKHRFSVAWLCLLILILGIVSACGGGEESTTPAATTPTTTTPAETTTPAATTPPQTTTPASTTPTQTPTTSTATVDPLTELFSKWTGLDPVYYDLTVSVTGQEPMTGHIWQTCTKQKIEYAMEGEHIVMIFDMDENVMYTYMPDQNMAMKATLEPGQMSQGTGEGDMIAVLDHDPVIEGTEYYDGKECMVIAFSTDEMSIKLWVWVDTGFPIRTEGTTPDGILTVMEYTNIDFSDIPDSVFQIPEGVQIIEM
jgi:hypothetical protein